MNNGKKVDLHNDLFSGFKVVTKFGTELSSANKHQIQQVALLLNAYETFK